MKASSLKQMLALSAGMIVCLAGLALGQDGLESAGPPAGSPPGAAVLAVDVESARVRFQVQDERAASLRLTIRDEDGHVLSDSGEQGGVEAVWDAADWLGTAPPGQALVFELLAWGSDGRLLVRQGGEIRRDATQSGTVLAVKSYTVPGNYTIGGALGVGTTSPERPVHIKGPNAVFRMDRSSNTAAFMIVRNDDAGNILKSYVIGVNATAANNGSFVINDLGTAVTGSGINRLTIDNAGVAAFNGNVKATGFVTVSSRQFKTDIQPLRDALDKVLRMQGVTFAWKDNGERAMGLIAEDVAEVAPEVVAREADGRPAGIDYGRVAALLVESLKTQQAEIIQAERDCDRLEKRLEHALQARRGGRIPEASAANSK